jgi:hypothetical protein
MAVFYNYLFFFFFMVLGFEHRASRWQALYDLTHSTALYSLVIFVLLPGPVLGPSPK